MSDSMAQRMARLRLDALSAFEAGDYSLALDKLEAMRIIYDTTPNQEKDGLRIEWRMIEELTKRIERKQRQRAGYGKLHRVPLTYRPPGCNTENDCGCC